MTVGAVIAIGIVAFVAAYIWMESMEDKMRAQECDDCGEVKETAETVDDYGQSFGASYRVCKSCYEATPEPDTGRPDWEDLL